MSFRTLEMMKNHQKVHQKNFKELKGLKNKKKIPTRPLKLEWEKPEMGYEIIYDYDEVVHSVQQITEECSD